MKNQKLVKILALSTIFTASMAVMAACKGTDEHSLTLIEGQAATCTADGWESYYMCSHCDLIFSDAEAKHETSLEAIKIEKLGHDFSELHPAKEAECTEPGNVAYYTCSREEGKYFNEQGEEISTIVTTKAHDFSGEGTHAYIQPTTEHEGSQAYWQCNDCHNVYADANGDTLTTVEAMKIDKVKENLDGTLTESFYHTENAYSVGNGGLGFTINGRRETDGIYLHIVANYNTSADDQTGDHGKIGLLVNFRNENDLNLPGSLGVCIEQSIYMELYLSGRVAYHDANTIKYFNTVTNGEGASTKYTTTWELFLSYEDLAAANGGKLADAFEVKDGKTALKATYAAMLTAVGNMTYAEADRFESANGVKCDLKDDYTWLMWYKEGYGDWSTDQKYMALGKEGFFADIPRAVDTYTVTKNDSDHATITAPATVDWDGSITGSVTVAEGYVLSGVKVNGKVAVTKGTPTQDNVYDYSVSVPSLDLKWNETEIALEFVITKLDYQDISFTLQGIAGGKTHLIAAGTAVVLENEFGDRYESTVGENGVVMFTSVLCQDYVVKVADYLEETVDVIKGETLGTVQLGYHFAHNAGNRADLVDLTNMNDENASITLGAQGENGVDKNIIAAQIRLSDEMKNADAYVLYTTVTANGEIEAGTGAWLQRFGIRFAEGDEGNTYNNKFVIWWDDLGLNSNPSAIWTNNGTNLGGGDQRAATYDWLASNIMDGLQLKVVRNGGYIAISVYNLDDETWYTLLEGTTSVSAKNDITFFVSGESFKFSNISFEALEVVPLRLPDGTNDGVKGHLTASNGDVFASNGVITSLDALSIPADSFAYTDYDDVEIDDGNETITINGNGINDRNNHAYNHATYILPQAVQGEKQVALVFNVKDVQASSVSGDDWAARRFGIQIGAGAYGVYFWTSDGNNFNLNSFIVGTLDMNTDREGQGIADVQWAASLIRSADGLDVQIVRIGTKLVVNFKNADGIWVKVGETDCPDSIETEVKFVGGGDTWKVSEIAVTKVEYVDATEATTEAAGNLAYYTDGTNYYLTDGTVTTAEAVVIPQIVAQTVEISVEVYGTDGNKITDADLSGVTVTLTGEYDYNADIYANLTVENGKLVLQDGKIYQGVYAVTVNGFAVNSFTVDKDAEALTLKLYQIAGYQITEATKTYKAESVTTGFNENGVTVKLIGAKGANPGDTIWDEYNAPVPEATVTLPEGIADSKNVSVEFNLKLSNEGFWGANAFGVSVVKGYNGFILRTFSSNDSEIDISQLYTQALCENNMKLLGKNAWVKGLSLTENGVNIRVIRSGASLTLYAQNAEGEWEKLFDVACDVDAETEIKFMGAAADFTVSNIVVCSAPATFATPDGYVKASENIVYHAYVAPTVAADGCQAYYSVGDTVYTVNGEQTTLAALAIGKITASEITLTVKGHKDGEEILLSGTVSATGDYDTAFEGTLTDGVATVNAYEVTYTVWVDGYIAKEFTVVAGTTAYELVLEYDFARATCKADQVDLSNMNETNHEIKLTGRKGANAWDTIWDEYNAPVPEATVTLPAELADSKNVSVEFNLKLSNEGFWGSNAFGVSVVKGYNGFILRTFGSDASEIDVSQLYMQALCEDNMKFLGKNTWVKGLSLTENGVNIRVIRSGALLTLYAQNAEGEWEKLFDVACDETAETEIKFMGAAADFTVSDIELAAYTPATITVTNGDSDSLTLNETSLTEGGNLTGSVASGKACAILVNGNSVLVLENGGDFTIEWSKLGITDETQITVSVFVTELTATASHKSCPAGNTNLDGETLDGKAIVDYARYQTAANGGVQHSGSAIGTQMDNHSRYGGDYDGTTTGTTFTVGEATNGDSAYINPDQYYDITLHIEKGVSVIRLYTGTYAEGRLTYVLSEMGITIADASFDRTSSDSRAIIVEFAIDTSSWTEGESHDLVLHIGGTADCELAAIVVLGEEVGA